MKLISKRREGCEKSEKHPASETTMCIRDKSRSIMAWRKRRILWNEWVRFHSQNLWLCCNSFENANNPEGKKERKQTKQTGQCWLKLRRFHRKKWDVENSMTFFFSVQCGRPFSLPRHVGETLYMWAAGDVRGNDRYSGAGWGPTGRSR